MFGLHNFIHSSRIIGKFLLLAIKKKIFSSFYNFIFQYFFHLFSKWIRLTSTLVHYQCNIVLWLIIKNDIQSSLKSIKYVQNKNSSSKCKVEMISSYSYTLYMFIYYVLIMFSTTFS